MTEGTSLPRLSPLTARRWLASGSGVGHQRVPGTVMFADISGYTKLCERLASRGRAGSEEAVQLISSVMEALIERIEARGGDILVFAGDAVVALFTGDGSARSATDAAAAIRRWFTGQESSTTSAGRVSLKAAIGLASGPIDLVLAGGEDAGLFVAGPTVSDMVRLEREASGGEVLVCARTARGLGGEVKLTERNGAFLVARSHTPAAGTTARPDDLPEDPRLVPRRLRDLVDSGASWSEGEHRLATMAFLVAGSLDARLAEDPATVADDLDRLYRVTAQAAAQHQVTLLSTDVTLDGIALFLGAGAPTTTGEDEERMLRTLREIMDDPIAERLELRAGTNRGPVFAGLVGAPHRAAYSAMGDTTNLAARLAFRAAPGDLYSTAAVLARSELEFAVEAAPEFHPKGKAEPVIPYCVGAVTGRHGRTADALPLVGRDSEMAQLTDLLDTALDGAGAAVTLTGDLGIGKTRLAAELLTDERIDTHLVVRFGSSDQDMPYGGLQHALRDLAGLSDLPAGDDALAEARFAEWATALLPSAQPWLPLLAVPFGLDLEPTPETANLDERFRRQRLHDLTADLLGELMGAGSVIALDDIHWSDEASLALLDHVVAGAPERGWLVLALSRDSAPALGGDRLVTIPLLPLADEPAAALAITAAGEAPLSDADLGAIVSRGAGSPLFLRELVAAVVAREGSGEELPEELESLLVARIDRLAPPDRALLSRATVLGRTVDLDLLADVLDEPQDLTRWGALDEFIEWVGTAQIRYRHDLYALAAYNGLPVRVRRDLHARVARELERRAGEDVGPMATQLAWHHARAGAAGPAYRWGRIAGDQARERFANVDATGLYRRALAEGQRAGVADADLASLAESLGDVAEMAGTYDDAMSAYATARRLLRGHRESTAAGARDALSRIARKSGIVCERTGRYREALGWYTRAERLLDEADDAPSRRTRLLLDRAGVRQRQGRASDTVALCLEATVAAQALGERAMLAHAYYLLHAAYGDLGSSEAERYRDLALPIYEELGDLSGQANALNNMGVDAYYAGRWDEALDLYRRSHDARQQIGDVTNAATQSNNEAEILSDQGRHDEARVLFSDVLRIWRAAGYEIGIALVTSNLGLLEVRAGRTDEGIALLEEALARFTALGSRYFVDDTHSRLAEGHLASGDLARAARLASEALAGQRDDEESVIVPILERTLGWCELRGGDSAAARRHFDTSLEVARKTDARFEVARTLHALLSLPADALTAAEREDAARESAAIFEDLGVAVP